MKIIIAKQKKYSKKTANNNIIVSKEDFAKPSKFSIDFLYHKQKNEQQQQQQQCNQPRQQ